MGVINLDSIKNGVCDRTIGVIAGQAASGVGTGADLVGYKYNRVFLPMFVTPSSIDLYKTISVTSNGPYYAPNNYNQLFRRMVYNNQGNTYYCRLGIPEDTEILATKGMLFARRPWYTIEFLIAYNWTSDPYELTYRDIRFYMSTGFFVNNRYKHLKNKILKDIVNPMLEYGSSFVVVDNIVNLFFDDIPNFHFLSFEEEEEFVENEALNYIQ